MSLKKIFALLLTLCCALALVACGSSSSTSKAAPSGAAAAAAAPAAQPPLAGKKVLVAYFSYSGQTERVAKVIQAKTKGDLFKIETTTPYPAGYHDCTAYAKEEKAKNGRPAIKPGPANLKDYDIVLLGFPIWWYDAPMAVYTFIEQNDLSGKTVISFCTSGGSSIGESTRGLKTALAKSKFQEGIRLYPNDEAGTQKWVESLGF